MSRRILPWVLFVVSIVIFYVAGYRAGYASGRGWRAAVLEGKCTIHCPTIVITEVPVNPKGSNPL